MIKKKQLGFSLIEIIISLAVFAMAASTIVSMSVGGFNALNKSGRLSEAEALVQEGLSAVQSIINGAWNEVVYSQSSIAMVDDEWVFNGEGTTEVIDIYTRTISFGNVCRDAVDEIVDCPGNYVDISTKELTVLVEWDNNFGVPSKIDRSVYLTNWDSKDWEQTDWIGGEGQSVWLDPLRFDYKDPNINTSVAGEMSLIIAQTGECAGKTWHFLDGVEYNYDDELIRVADSSAQLVPITEHITGIADEPIDLYEFDGNTGLETDVVQVNDNIYAVAYRGLNNDGFVRTIEIGIDGQITEPYIDSFEFEGKDGYAPHIIHIAGDVFAIAYSGRGRDGYLVTIEIDSSGNITQYNLDSYEYNNSDSYTPHIVKVSGNVYAIVFRHILSGGAMITLTIDDNGDIGNTIDVYAYSWWGEYDPTIVKVAEELFVVAYEDSGSGGKMFTVYIQNNGNIIESMVDTYSFDSNEGAEPDILEIADNIFLLAYRGVDNDGYVQTINIADNGQIMEPIIDSFEYNTEYGYDPQVTHLIDDLYGVVYHNGSSYGYMTLFYIDGTGDIDENILDTFSFDINAGGGCLSLSHVAGLVYALTYDGLNNDGFIITIELSTIGVYPTDGPNIFPNDAYVPPTVDIWVKMEETASKDGGEIYYQISDDNGLNWYYWDSTAWVKALFPSNYNTMVEINEHLWEWETVSDSFKFNAFLVSDGSQNVQLDAVTINCSNFQVEAGSISTDEHFVRVPLVNIYSSPVVVVGYHENNNSLPASVRLENVTSSFFDIALKNPNDRNLAVDNISYFVIEEGIWQMDGINIEAHVYTTDTVGSDPNWLYDVRPYNYAFTSAPVIMHQVMSNDDPQWITTYVSSSTSRSNPPGLNDFRIAMNGAEAYNVHGQETLGWIAVESDTVGIFGEIAFETYRTTDSVYGHDNGCYSFNYQNIYVTAPLVISAQQEMDDTDGSWSVICQKDELTVGLHSEEDTYFDSERGHDTETHSFMAFAEPFSFSSIGDATAYQNNGDLVSSALDMSNSAVAIQTVSWTELLPGECPLCEVMVQIKSADTEGGLSTVEWSGPLGIGDSFVEADGELVNVLHNGDQWVQYQVTLQGDGDYTPIVRDININYK